ncbi:MAG: hypothetical protein HY674_16360, partial [Chloroflexi bacterium]|nr:hypothetical protein [Chloroflexota bacterium]
RVFSELQKRGVIVRPMGGYQLPEWIRISIGTPEENVRCLEGLKELLKSKDCQCAEGCAAIDKAGPNPGADADSGVAQVSNLLYRRFPIGSAPEVRDRD